MYIADATGYLGYVAVMLFKLMAKPSGSFLDFFTAAATISLALAFAAFVLAWRTFARLPQDTDPGPKPSA